MHFSFFLFLFVIVPKTWKPKVSFAPPILDKRLWSVWFLRVHGWPGKAADGGALIWSESFQKVQTLHCTFTSQSVYTNMSAIADLCNDSSRVENLTISSNHLRVSHSCFLSSVTEYYDLSSFKFSNTKSDTPKNVSYLNNTTAYMSFYYM